MRRRPPPLRLLLGDRRHRDLGVRTVKRRLQDLVLWLTEKTEEWHKQLRRGTDRLLDWLYELTV